MVLSVTRFRARATAGGVKRGFCLGTEGEAVAMGEGKEKERERSGRREVEILYVEGSKRACRRLRLGCWQGARQ